MRWGWGGFGWFGGEEKKGGGGGGGNRCEESFVVAIQFRFVGLFYCSVGKFTA